MKWYPGKIFDQFSNIHQLREWSEEEIEKGIDDLVIKLAGTEEQARRTVKDQISSAYYDYDLILSCHKKRGRTFLELLFLKRLADLAKFVCFDLDKKKDQRPYLLMLKAIRDECKKKVMDASAVRKFQFSPEPESHIHEAVKGAITDVVEGRVDLSEDRDALRTAIDYNMKVDEYLQTGNRVNNAVTNKTFRALQEASMFIYSDIKRLCEPARVLAQAPHIEDELPWFKNKS